MINQVKVKNGLLEKDLKQNIQIVDVEKRGRLSYKSV